MELESRPAFNGESKTHHAGGGFEPSKEGRRRRRHERRSEREHTRERTHAPLEPLTIWVRSDPNRLQRPEGPREETQEKPHENESSNASKQEAKKHKLEQKLSRRQEASNEATPKKVHEIVAEAQPRAAEADPRTEGFIPAPEAPNPKPSQESSVKQPAEDIPVFQELPRLDIRPRHFYTEPEIRQPHTTETEHDILPPLKSASEEAPKPQAPEQSAPAAEKLPQTGQQLQELAEKKAKRAEELKEKYQEEPQEPVLPAPQETAPPAAINEHVRAIAGGNYETDIQMGRNELLEMGDSIRLEGVSVADMYHAQRIDEEGLRRIVVEFLRGQRIEKIISEEVLRQQMRFERDPQLRQVPVSTMSDGAEKRSQSSMSSKSRKINTQSMRRQADRIADRLAGGIDRAVETAENNPNIAKTVGGVLAVIAYFVILILIIRS